MAEIIIRTNFRSAWLQKWTLVMRLLWALAALGGVLAITLIVVANELESDSAGAQERIDDLTTKLDTYQERVSVATDEDRRLKAIAEELAGLEVLNFMAPAEVLYLLERHVPQGIHLNSYEHEALVGRVRFAAIAQQNKEISQLIRNLEKIDTFSKVRLVKQRAREDRTIEFEVLVEEGSP